MTRASGPLEAIVESQERCSFSTALELSGRDSRPAGGDAPLEIRRGDPLAAMGDSITQNGGYLRAAQAVFTQQYPALAIPPIINAGVSGEKAEEMVVRFQRDIVERKPAIVTISVGINDVYHRLTSPDDAQVLAAFGRNVERMVQMALGAGIRPILLAPTIIDEDPASEGNQRLAKYVAAGKEIARRLGAGYADLHALFLRAVDSHARWQPDGKPVGSGYLTRDGVHMNPIGDVVMAVGLLRALGVPDDAMVATDVSEVFR